MKHLLYHALLIVVCCISLNCVTAQQNAELQYDKQANLYYSVWNDTDSFHIMVTTADPSQQMKIARNGVEIWIDLKAKSSKKAGFQYPLPSQVDIFQLLQQQQQRSQNNGDTGRPSLRPVIELTLMTKNEMEITGLKEDINGKHDLGFNSGISIVIDFLEKDTLRYMASIPFSAFATAINLENPVSFGIVIKGMERPDAGNNGFSGGGAPGGGGRFAGGGRSGAGRPGGGSRPDTRDMEKMFSNTSVWYKLTPKK